MEAQPLFLYPADWMAARAPRLEAEDALALAHFQGKNNLLRRLNALKRADFSHHADRIRCPVQIICASDDLLVPTACSSELHAALPDSQKMVMRYGGHACNVTDADTFNALLLNGLASLLHRRPPWESAMNEAINHTVRETLVHRCPHSQRLARDTRQR